MAMAAHNEKISNKRRRLFKALSTVPVVMTLRPGSALANQSAFQCLDTGENIADWHDASWPDINDPCPEGEICYAYERRYYWDTTTGTKVPNTTCPTLNNIIVQTNTGFLDFTGNDATPFVTFNPTDTTLMILQDGEGKACVEDIPRQEGLFAVVGHPIDDNTDFVIDGTVPEARIQTGYQGITGTCLTSIAGTVPPNYTLSRG